MSRVGVPAATGKVPVATGKIPVPRRDRKNASRDQKKDLFLLLAVAVGAVTDVGVMSSAGGRAAVWEWLSATGYPWVVRLGTGEGRLRKGAGGKK